MASTTARGMRGAVFDGRYVYFVPSDALPIDGLVVRYDTQSSWNSASSWSTFDVSAKVSSSLQGFMGGLFDGRYIYLLPDSNMYGSFDGFVARYDTQAPFTSASSWSSFDVSTVDGAAKGFAGGTFDGRYLYLVPNNSNNHKFARYDTTSGWPGTWTTFDVSPLSAAKSYFGAVFDGRYVYLSPTYNGGAAGDGLVIQYDTQQSFTSASAYHTFDIAAQQVTPSTPGFEGAAFDGRYVYFVPSYNGAAYSVVVRYDTQKNFTVASSWESFDTTKVDPNAGVFRNAGFDGRYIYLVPQGANWDVGVVMRYDTQEAFASGGSWSKFDITNVAPNAKGFFGAVFDGQSLYLTPNGNGSLGTVARFDAKTPPSMPKLCSSAAALYCFTGSFF